jgi:hypothetical protein
MHPVVERPEQRVGVVLDVRLTAAVGIGDRLFRVSLAVPVGVLHVPEVRRFRHQHPFVEHFQRPRQYEAVGEDRPFVHPAVAVGVLERDDAAGRVVLVAGADVGHVARHLDRPQPAFLVPVDDDRILDEGLARHELEPVTRRQRHRRELLRGRQDGGFPGAALQVGAPRQQQKDADCP